MTSRRAASICWVAWVVAACMLMAAWSGTALAASPVCGALNGPPGTLTGTYHSNVVVEGTCLVNSGPAVVGGNLIVKPGATLQAAFALDARHPGSGPGSHLKVNGNLTIGEGASVLLGCLASSFPCVDDPALKRPEEQPTLASRSQVFGNILSRGAILVIAHNDRVKGNVTQTGGGGGETCEPPGQEAFSAYEDSSINGNLTITGLESCWLGLNRLKVHGNVKVSNDRLADPDAIEILSNTIVGNLACREDTMVWDSAEQGFPELFPRTPLPNTVSGKRSGQCVLASPETEGGPLGPGPF